MLHPLRPPVVFFVYTALVLMCCLSGVTTLAQTTAEKGLPFITNYKAKVYDASPQNWCIMEADNGLMYFGNSFCLLEYDGVKWRRISDAIVRTMTKDQNGRIYYGAYDDFGYLASDSLGQTQLRSLMPQVPKTLHGFNDVWSAYAGNDGIYFQARERLFRLREKSPGRWEVKAWRPSTKYMYAFYLDGTLYVHEQGVGLLKLQNDQLQLIPGSEFLGSERTQVMLPYPAPQGQKHYLVGQFYSGLYHFDGKTFKRFPTEADHYIVNNTLYKATQLKDGTYALSSTGAGLVVIDARGRLLQRINRDVGLQDESIYGVYSDNKGALWLGLDNGISKVQTASPFTQFAIESGVTSAALSAVRFGGRLYLGTTNGLLVFNEQAARFEPIEAIPRTQTFSLLPDGATLLVPSDGLFGISGGKPRMIQPSGGGDVQIQSLLISKQHPRVLLVTLAGGFGIFSRKAEGAEWQFLGRVPGISDDVWTIAEDHNGSIWIGTQDNGVLRLKLSVDAAGVPVLARSRVERFDSSHGLSPGSVSVMQAGGVNYFGTRQGLYRFDERKNRFVRDHTFGELHFGDDVNEYIMITDARGRVWISMEKGITLATPKAGGGYTLEKVPFLPLADRSIAHIYPEANGTTWICTPEGLVRYDEHLKMNYDQPFKTVLRQVAAGKKRLSTGAGKAPDLSYSNNTLRFDFAAPFYEQEDKTQYQTWLEGFEPGWSDWDNNHYKEYTNLPNGNYRFHVRAKNIYQKVGAEAVYAFGVLPPWYRTWWAYLLYVLIGAGVLYAVVRYRTHQLHLKHRELERTVAERTGELSQRVEELAMINSVQESLVAQIDIQAIYDLVGEKIRQIFNAQVIDIVTYDKTKNLIEDRYAYEKGDYTKLGPREPNGFRKHVIQTKQVLLINENIEQVAREYDNAVLIGDMPKSMALVPMIAGSEVTGIISLQDLDKEHAISQSDVNLLTTMANSMSVALESARLFDETKVLLRETEQRNAELAVINSLQEGLVREMNIQGIYDLVGEKIRKVFNAQVVDIVTYDRSANLIEDRYAYEKGDRTLLGAREPKGFRRHVLDTGQVLLINRDVDGQRVVYDNTVLVGQSAKSVLFVPMIAGGKTTGVISLQNTDQEDAFTESDVKLLTTLTNSMSVALEGARLFEETRTLLAETEKGKRNVELLSEIGKQITASLDFETIFYKLYEHINQLADATVFGIGLYEPERRLIDYKFAVEKGKRYAPYTRDTEDKNQFPVWCIENRKPVFINDVTQEYSRYISSFKDKELLLEDGTVAEEPLSLIYLPLMVQERVLGIITIQSFNKHAYSEYHLNLLQNLATYTSIALDNANAYRQLNMREQEIGRRAAELATVNSISQALASQLNLKELIELVGEQMRDLFRANIVYLALLDKKTRTITFPYQYGDDLKPMKLGEGLTSRILLSGEPLLINQSVKTKTEELGVNQIGVPAASYLGVPIPVGDEVIGVLSVQSTVEENRFDERDQGLLATIAASVGVAIRKAKLFEEVKQARQEAEAARKTAEQANEAKSAFLSTVSHELRTPLTSVLGFAKIIKKRLEDKVFPLTDRTDPKTARTIEQVSENLSVVVAEGERLTHLINDVLDLAKIEAGKMEWNMGTVSITEVIERAIAATTALFYQKNIPLEREFELELPDITGDRDKLIQVVVNLLSNAVKFTDRGSVTCRAFTRNGEVVVSVADTGIGIAPQDHAAVFEQFRQVGDTLTDKPKGTGLGLPISKEIIEHHGGRIWLESEVGKGSTFSFALPVTKAGAVKPLQLDDLVRRLKEQMAQSHFNIKGNATILIVDDEEAIRSLLRQELSEAGYLVEEAANGREALERVRANKPDLIILDIMMPEINGFDVAAILKNDPQTMDIPIIVLSIVQDKARGYRIGVDRYLTKPIDTTLLFSEVGHLLEQGKSKKKVMVVDEDSVTVNTLADVLAAKGYQVVESDGKELVEKAIATQPDIIILNSVLNARDGAVQSLRFEKGLENVLFLIYQNTPVANTELENKGNRD